jgi:hypothetical protein
VYSRVVIFIDSIYIQTGTDLIPPASFSLLFAPLPRHELVNLSVLDSIQFCIAASFRQFRQFSVNISTINPSTHLPLCAIYKNKRTGPEGSRRLRLPDFKTMGTWRCQGCQPYAPVAFTLQEIFLVLISLRGWVDPRAIAKPEDYVNEKIPMTPSGIERAPFLLAAQCLNQVRYGAPPYKK